MNLIKEAQYWNPLRPFFEKLEKKLLDTLWARNCELKAQLEDVEGDRDEWKELAEQRRERLERMIRALNDVATIQEDGGIEE